MALNLKSGDKVYLPNFTYVATAAAVVAAGGQPVLVDCDKTGRMDPEAIRMALQIKDDDAKEEEESRQQFLMVVHLYGHPCDMVAIMAIASEYNLIVIEDCAEAHGAKCGGRLVGSFGQASTYSFFANKIMTTGEGGMVCTNDSKLAERLKFLSTHAMDPNQRYFHTEVGFNYRMSNLLCAIGCAQLERFSALVEGRQRLINYYKQEIDGICGGVLVNPTFADDVVLSPWLACIYLTDVLSSHRDEICKKLLLFYRIDTRPFFHPLHVMPPYSDCVTVTREGKNHVPVNSIRMHQLGFNIPTASDMSDENAKHIVTSIQAVLAEYSGVAGC